MWHYLNFEGEPFFKVWGDFEGEEEEGEDFLEEREISFF